MDESRYFILDPAFQKHNDVALPLSEQFENFHMSWVLVIQHDDEIDIEIWNTSNFKKSTRLYGQNLCLAEEIPFILDSACALFLGCFWFMWTMFCMIIL